MKTTMIALLATAACVYVITDHVIDKDKFEFFINGSPEVAVTEVAEDNDASESTREIVYIGGRWVDSDPDGEPLIKEKVIDLPEDGNAYYLTLFVDRGSMSDSNYVSREKSKSRQLIEWFVTDPRLASLKTQCHTKIMANDDPLFKNRYANRLASPVHLPAICLQYPSGKVLYRRHAGASMPKTAADLADSIATTVAECKECWPLRPRPRPKPVVPVPVTPKPAPLEFPAPADLSDVGDEPEPEAKPDPEAPIGVIATILTVLGGLGAFWASWRQSNL